MNKKPKTATVVERAIEHVGGAPSELARRLSEISGEDIARQRVNGWRMRGIFPREMIPHVHTLTGISVAELVAAKVIDRDKGNIVNRAIRLRGADTTPGEFAKELSKISGKKVTRQMVNGWQATEQFPIEFAAFVHLMTKIPVKELIEQRGRRKSKLS